jgi:transketolase
MQIVVAGTANEFEKLYLTGYDNGAPTYYRLSRDMNETDMDVVFGKATVVKRGTYATVIAVGPMLKTVLKAVTDLDVTVLYYTTVEPFDYRSLAEHCQSGKVILCEPYYEGGLLLDILKALPEKRLCIDTFGFPHEFCAHYGSTVENMAYWKITPEMLHSKIERMISSRT